MQPWVQSKVQLEEMGCRHPVSSLPRPQPRREECHLSHPWLDQKSPSPASTPGLAMGAEGQVDQHQ